jgi:hypothetical protein
MASSSFGLHNQLLRCTEAGKTQAEEQVAPPGAQVRVRQKVTLVPGDRGFGCYPAGLEGLAWPVPAASALPGHVRSKYLLLLTESGRTQEVVSSHTAN